MLTNSQEETKLSNGLELNVYFLGKRVGCIYYRAGLISQNNLHQCLACGSTSVRFSVNETSLEFSLSYAPRKGEFFLTEKNFPFSSDLPRLKAAGLLSNNLGKEKEFLEKVGRKMKEKVFGRKFLHIRKDAQSLKKSMSSKVFSFIPEIFF